MRIKREILKAIYHELDFIYPDLKAQYKTTNVFQISSSLLQKTNPLNYPYLSELEFRFHHHTIR